MSKQEEIIEVAGERVEVRYESDYYEACDKCCFHNVFVRCNVRTLCNGCPCKKYRDNEKRRFAYFVEAEQPEADLEAEIERKYKADATTMKTRDQYATLARHFAEWGAEHLKK